MMKNFFEQLSQDYTELLNDEEDYNVIIEVGKGSDKKLFKAHSSVLRHRSSHFREELKNAPKNESNIRTIVKTKITVQIFDIIMKYIYGGIVNLENLEASTILDLMISANDLELGELTDYLETQLMDSKHWVNTHFVHVYRVSFQSNNFKKLQKHCNDIVAKFPTHIFDSEDFKTIQESALVSILERDDLQMEESKIWDKVITWGTSQNPNLPTNLDQWADEDFAVLKTTLQKCLPHIRYFHIPGEDLYDKVQPYMKILEPNLWKALMQKFMTPNRAIKFTILPARKILTTPAQSIELISNILTREHIAEISTWIDRKNEIYDVADIPYGFKLLLSGTRDGFSSQIFWDKCDMQSETVVVMKVKGTDEILGGYNPLPWIKGQRSFRGSYEYYKTTDSFIFSLKNGSIQTSTLSRVRNPSKAISKYSDDRAGPIFGTFNLGIYAGNFNDDKACFNTNELAYEEWVRNTREQFSLDDYEVFKIVRPE